ncbi:MAG: glycosyltransferase, partial [Planctomycetia bacterium]|nr:glycosyltransferase [Planctomycetia bacterium]
WIRTPAPISVVPNGIESSILSVGSGRLAGGEPPKPFALATVLQGFQDRKNPKTAIAAFALVRRRFPTAAMLMFGTDYETGGPAESWAKAKGLDQGITFMGKIAHAKLLPIIADNVHLLIHPAKEESFGMAPLEAMALGIPVIGGNDSGGVPYVLDGGRAGTLVNVSSSAEIADAACSILEDPKQRSDQAQAGWQQAAGKFSLERMVSLYEQEYAAVLGHPEAGKVATLL